MNEKEKARELVEKFRQLAKISGGTGDSIPAAKQCALICVDEMLEMLNQMRVTRYVRNEVDYLNKVKNQIKEL